MISGINEKNKVDENVCQGDLSYFGGSEKSFLTKRCLNKN